MAIFDNPLNDLIARPSWITKDYDKPPSGVLMYAIFSEMVDLVYFSSSRVINVRVDYTDGTNETDFMDQKKCWCYFTLTDEKQIQGIRLETPSGYPTLKNYYVSHYFLY